MMPRRAAPPFHGLVPSDDAWDLVIKVKYGDTLKRFNACVNGPHFDRNLATLRSEIASAFKFSPDAEFILTYTDEDEDVVMLDDDNDLRDAAISQKLNPLRINVQLKSSSAGAPQTKQQASNSTSPMSTALEDQLAQVKSAIDEALKFVPEQVPVVLAKLSHDLRSKAASSLAELLDRFAKLMTPKSNMQPCSGPTDGSSGSCDGPQTLGNFKMTQESELITVSASQPSDVKDSKSSKAFGLKSVLVEQASGYPSFEDPLISASSGGEKINRKGNTDVQSKGKSRVQGNWKSVISSAMPPVASIAHGVPTLRSGPAPSMGENAPIYELNATYTPFRSNGNINGDLHSIFPSPPPVPPYCSIPHLGGDGKTSCDLDTSFPQPTYSYPPPTYNYNPFKLNMPSLVSPYGPYPEGFSSFGGSNRDLSVKYGSVPQRTLHRWIQCDGCGVTPISGPRYKSNVKDDYDLCSACFSHMGNGAEYTRIDRPSLVSEILRDANKNRGLPSWLQQDKLECRFIKDVTVPDGTVMVPSTPFTKIWRMRNNGSTMWPFGTHLIWVGGNQFARQSSVKLGISMDGFPVDQEIDVGVDFIAPAKPGRHISYWRLALPSGQKFGQRVWVLIQVEQPVQTSSNKQQAAINLNLPPEGNNTKWKPFISSAEPTDLVYKYPGSTSTFAHSLFHETVKPKVSEPVLSAVPSAPKAIEPVRVPITDPYTSSTGPVSISMPAAPEAIPLPKPVSVPAPTFFGVPAPAPDTVLAPAPAPVSVPSPTLVRAPVPVPAPVIMPTLVHAPAPVSVPVAPSPDELVNHMEEKLLRELEEVGFRQVDLNKEILRQNKYNLEQSVDDLCNFLEWDPLLEELHEPR